MTNEKRIAGLVHSEILHSINVRIGSSNSNSNGIPLSSSPPNLKAGPFQIIDSHAAAPSESPAIPPRRRYECVNYETCLNLAAALNWDNFTCRGCSGEVDESLLWRARQAFKRDAIVKALCEVPEIPLHQGEPEPDFPIRIAGKGR